MDSIDIEQFADQATHRKGRPADERILALDSREQGYLSHLAVLTEGITPEEIALFLGYAAFTLRQKT